MLHQLMGGGEGSLSRLIDEWDPPDPETILEAVKRWNATDTRTVFLVVDGLDMISNLYGEMALTRLLLQLGGLASGRNSFRIICATSRTSEPIYKSLKVTSRRKIDLPCSLINPPSINGVEVFRTGDSLENILARDCGGRGRALECMFIALRIFPQAPNSEVTSKKSLGIHNEHL